MKNVKIILTGVLIALSASLFSQNSLPVPFSIQNAIKNGSRTTSGEPGMNYWQNHASYLLNIEFDTENGIIHGYEEITYYNNSPDTLKEIIFKLYPNIYKKGSPRQFQLDPSDINDGLKFSSFSVNNKEYSKDNLIQEGTIMRAQIPPLKPKDKLNINLSYSYIVNKYVRDDRERGGKVDDSSWFIAYFFPRIAVYDDIDGWDTIPHTGIHEFYNDFCDFDLNITVPKDFIVWATGELQNSSDVFTKKYCDRLKSAGNSDSIILIIDIVDIKEGKLTSKNKKNTFKFVSKNLPDVAFAVSDHYVWKSSSIIVDSITERRVRLDVAFNPEHEEYYDIIDFSKKSIGILSFVFPQWPYPYPKMIVFDGNSEMEYPMMVNYRATGELDYDVNTTLHEIAHTIFPFFTGLNEIKNGWIDEGLASMTNLVYSTKVDANSKGDAWVNWYLSLEDIGYDIPIISYTHQQNSPAVLLNLYTKPALGFLFLKELVGDEVFINGIHYFIKTWNGKHPTFIDFINCMNKGFGAEQNWFWKAWFFEPGVPDLSIRDFNNIDNENTILIEMTGSKPTPIALTVFFNDSTKKEIYKSIGIWKSGNKTVKISFLSDKKIKKIKLGNEIIPDLNLNDNQLTLE